MSDPVFIGVDMAAGPDRHMIWHTRDGRAIALTEMPRPHMQLAGAVLRSWIGSERDPAKRDELRMWMRAFKRELRLREREWQKRRSKRERGWSGR